MTATWTSAPDPVTGYDVEASTASDFTGTLVATITPNTSALTLTFNNGQLLANTTYFARVGALYNGATTYINTVPSSTSTWTSLIQAAQVYQTFTTSVTVNWIAMSVGTGTNTSEGYRLEASSTNFNGTGTIFFSSNTTPSVSTLTVNGLQSNVAYNLRAGAINWDGVVNFVTPTGSPATTGAGAAPNNPQITNVYLSSMSVTWGSVASPSGYSLEVSTMANFTGTIISSVTADGTMSGLSFNLGQLAADTTYFARVGALYNGATSYAFTTPQSTSTLTSSVTGSQIFGVGVTSVTVNWVALSSGIQATEQPTAIGFKPRRILPSASSMRRRSRRWCRSAHLQ